MKYTNPQIPEGINTRREHPLKEFAVLAGGLLLVITIIAVALSLLADQLALRIPYAYEQTLASRYNDSLPDRNKITEHLQALADRLTETMDLPEDMVITVHYVDEDVVNAYATLGGHVVIYRGLLEKLPHRNALAMVLAHEIAHVKYRHPIRSLGRGVVVGLALAALADISANDFAGHVLGDAGLLTLLKFSRDQEREADRTGLRAVAKLYGHVSGALDLYRVLLEERSAGLRKVPAFLSTHPLTEDRIAELKAYSRENAWALDQPTSRLSGALTELQ